jgi:hypothetical protein
LIHYPDHDEFPEGGSVGGVNNWLGSSSQATGPEEEDMDSSEIEEKAKEMDKLKKESVDRKAEEARQEAIKKK